MIMPIVNGWQVGFTKSADAAPEYLMPAQVPGSVQQDYARYHEWPPFTEGVNFRDYRWMEDVYWRYSAPMHFDVQPNEAAYVVFKGIDYRYHIRVDGELLVEGEGMFSTVRLDVTKFAGRDVVMEVLLDPVPKTGNSGDRDECRMSCKAVACYGWDWHPRLISTGIWDDVTLEVVDEHAILVLDAAYELSAGFDLAKVTASVSVNQDAFVRFALRDGKEVVAQCTKPSENGGCTVMLEVEEPKLWYPHGYGEQHRYLLVAETLDEHGRVLHAAERKIGLRRSKLVMNAGSWDEPSQFPKSRSDAPATFEINGRRMFVKGSNWVNAQVFPGDMNEENYRQLLTLVKDANMNILRIWGGGFINKESFFDLCDEMGVMIWEEFPLACTEYPDDDGYLAVLKQEGTAIVRKLRTHPCVVLWCGGNELFNNWSLMTDQHHALRLLDSICYNEDRFTPFIMTSPLNGMGHGHYVNYDEFENVEFLNIVSKSNCTAYTEFGSPGAADPEYIKQYISEEDYADCNITNEVWVEHHAFKAWGPGRWLRKVEAEYYYGGYDGVDDLCRKTQVIQAMCYKSLFEEMRKQWPHCAMSLNWCFNEPWPCFANNSLITWPVQPRPAYYAVKEALRPTMASLRVDRNLRWAGDAFQAGVWMMNDSSIQPLESNEITVFYQLGDGEMVEWGTLRSPKMAAQENRDLGTFTFPIPADFEGTITVKLCVRGHEEWNSEYRYPCRKKVEIQTTGMLNM